MKKSLIAFTLLLGSLPVAQDIPASARIERWSIELGGLRRTFGGTRREPSKFIAYVRNTHASEAINSIEVQFDVIDSMRRVVKERIFLKVEDIGFGDRSIKSAKSARWSVEMGRFEVPEGCADYGTAYGDSDCLKNLKVNVVRYKSGAVWERAGWRDEPNPNKDK